MGFPGGSIERIHLPWIDMGSTLGLGRAPGGENGDSLQYSCLKNPMDGGTWQAAVQGVTKSWM